MGEIIPMRPSEPDARLPAECCSPVPVPTHGYSERLRCVGRGKGESFACPVLWNKTIEFISDRPEALGIRTGSFGDAALAEITAPPMLVTQDGSAKDDPHRFHLVLLIEGHGEYRWAGGAFTQAPGDIVLIDTAQPSQVISPVDCHLLRWSFPEALVAPFLPQRVDQAVLHLPASNGLNTVLTRHTRELAREAERLDCTTQHAMLAHLCGLLGLAVESVTKPHPPARSHNYRAYQRQRVLNYIETHLYDPRLTVSCAARDLDMSPRWLHALLQDTADGFSGLVAGRRLERSRMLLEDPASENLSIAEIAFLSGFNDLSTFYRRFGQRYGMTPGAARRMRSSVAERRSKRLSADAADMCP